MRRRSRGCRNRVFERRSFWGATVPFDLNSRGLLVREKRWGVGLGEKVPFKAK